MRNLTRSCVISGVVFACLFFFVSYFFISRVEVAATLSFVVGLGFSLSMFLWMYGVLVIRSRNFPDPVLMNGEEVRFRNLANFIRERSSLNESYSLKKLAIPGYMFMTSYRIIFFGWNRKEEVIIDLSKIEDVFENRVGLLGSGLVIKISDNVKHVFVTERQSFWLEVINGIVNKNN